MAIPEILEILLIAGVVYGALRTEFYLRRWKFRREAAKAKAAQQLGSQPEDPFHPAINPRTGVVEGAAIAILCDSCHEPTTDYWEYFNGERHCLGCVR